MMGWKSSGFGVRRGAVARYCVSLLSRVLCIGAVVYFVCMQIRLGIVLKAPH